MQDEFDIQLGKVNLIYAVKTQKLAEYRNEFKYENPHKKPFFFDFSYIGNEDCPHVLNNEIMELLRAKRTTFGDVVMLFRINNRNKKGLKELIQSIENSLNKNSAVVFISNALQDIVNMFEISYNLDKYEKIIHEQVDILPYLETLPNKTQNFLYLNLVKRHSYSKIAKTFDISTLVVKNTIIEIKKEAIKSIIQNKA